MIARLFIPDDYPMICEWWKIHGWPPIPQEVLSNLGLVVEYEKKSVCAGWVYTTNSSLGWLEWVVVNPDSVKAIRTKALDFLIDTSKKSAEKVGIHQIFIATRGASYIHRLKRHGFTVTDDKMTHLIWVKGENHELGTALESAS